MVGFCLCLFNCIPECWSTTHHVADYYFLVLQHSSIIHITAELSTPRLVMVYYITPCSMRGTAVHCFQCMLCSFLWHYTCSPDDQEEEETALSHDTPATYGTTAVNSGGRSDLGEGKL